MASARNALLVVAKRPAPGHTKTRLTPPLSPEQAAALYECLLRDTLDLIRRVPDVQPAIAFLPDARRMGVPGTTSPPLRPISSFFRKKAPISARGWTTPCRTTCRGATSGWRS